jgi:hypothetical protein
MNSSYSYLRSPPDGIVPDMEFFNNLKALDITKDYGLSAFESISISLKLLLLPIS